jgi:hypothetical protein
MSSRKNTSCTNESCDVLGDSRRQAHSRPQQKTLIYAFVRYKLDRIRLDELKDFDSIWLDMERWISNIIWDTLRQSNVAREHPPCIDDVHWFPPKNRFDRGFQPSMQPFEANTTMGASVQMAAGSHQLFQSPKAPWGPHSFSSWAVFWGMFLAIFPLSKWFRTSENIGNMNCPLTEDQQMVRSWKAQDAQRPGAGPKWPVHGILESWRSTILLGCENKWFIWSHPPWPSEYHHPKPRHAMPV